MIIGGADFCAGVELVGPTKRMMLGVGIVVFWCLGMMMLTPFAYFIRYWKTLQMAVSAMPVFFLSYYWSVLYNRIPEETHRDKRTPFF